jgi:hypothetical protein
MRPLSELRCGRHIDVQYSAGGKAADRMRLRGADDAQYSARGKAAKRLPVCRPADMRRAVGAERVSGLETFR